MKGKQLNTQPKTRLNRLEAFVLLAPVALIAAFVFIVGCLRGDNSPIRPGCEDGVFEI